MSWVHLFQSYYISTVFLRRMLFPPLCDMLYAGHVKLLAEMLEFFMQTVLQLVCKMSPLECILQWAKRSKSEGAKSGLQG
jgi:hypothetical protein